MTPNRSRCRSLGWASMLAIAGIGIAATTAQAQRLTAAEKPISVGENLAPLKLPPLPPKDVPTKNFGDWMQRCDTRPGATQQTCLLLQTVVHTKDKQKRALLAMTVGLSGPDKKPLMVIQVPLALGTFLPPGFKLVIPGIEPVRVAIQSCLQIGCSAKVPLLPDIMAAMKKANAGSIEIHTLRKRVIKVPISFKGFTAALDSLGKG